MILDILGNVNVLQMELKVAEFVKNISYSILKIPAIKLDKSLL
jgi:hypothetical protein